MDTVRRGYDPGDEEAFGARHEAAMAAAAEEIRWLLARGYEAKPAVTFVGNHYQLSLRQRMALKRMLASPEDSAARKRKELGTLSGEVLMDGLNTIITLEVALSDSVVTEGDDGAFRDIADIHGTFRIVDKTLKAANLIFDELSAYPIERLTILLDRPVSNSGRLKALLEEKGRRCSFPIEVLLPDCPDREMEGKERVISSDAVVLDRCVSWFNLTGRIIREKIPEAWIVRYNANKS